MGSAVALEKENEKTKRMKYSPSKPWRYLGGVEV
jgi:hypothetical protein